MEARHVIGTIVSALLWIGLTVVLPFFGVAPHSQWWIVPAAINGLVVVVAFILWCFKDAL